MYPVSDAYKSAINARTRKWDARITIRTAHESFMIGGQDIIQNSLTLTERAMNGDDFSLGGAMAADFAVSFRNLGGQYDDIQFNGAELRPEIGLLVDPDTYEWVPLGIFFVDEVDRKVRLPDRPVNVVSLAAADRMMRLDVPFSQVAVTFPTTARNLLAAVCAHCRIPLSASAVAFPNYSYSIRSRPVDDMSCRDVLACIAQIAGGWARCNRQGQLEMGWFRNPGFVQEANLDGNVDSVTGGDFEQWNSRTYDGGVFAPETPNAVLDGSNRFDFAIDDEPIFITGLSLENDEGVFLVGSDRYVISIEDNPLMQDGIPALLGSIWSRLRGFTFMPCTSNRRDDPAIQAGDMVLHEGVNGQDYRTIITEYAYKYQGKCQIVAAGLSETAHSYRSPSVRKIATLRRKVSENRQQVNAMDTAIDNAFAMFAGTWGGYRINGDDLPEEKHHGNEYLADKPDINQATKIWAKNLGGIFYFEEGINKPPQSAWTADGKFVAPIITAGMLQTGLIRSLNGESVIDLDDGSFSLGNGALKWSAEEGFEAVSAKQIKNAPDSRTWGEIGELKYWDNIANVSGLSLTGPSNMNLPDTSDLRTYFMALNLGSGVAFVTDENNPHPFLRAIRGGDTILSDYHANMVWLDSASGVRFYKNGQLYGASGTFRSADSKSITVTNGIITSIT